MTAISGAAASVELSLDKAKISNEIKSLERSKHMRGGEGARDRVRQVAQDFEAIFTGIMLKSMRESVQKAGLIDGGNAENIYESLLDAEYSKLLAAQGNGISDTIERYLLESMGLQKSPLPAPEVKREAVAVRQTPGEVESLGLGKRREAIQAYLGQKR